MKALILSAFLLTAAIHPDTFGTEANQFNNDFVKIRP